MHADQTGGLPDVPWAKVHVYERDYQATMHPRPFSVLDQIGIEPVHRAHQPQWVIHREADEP